MVGRYRRWGGAPLAAAIVSLLLVASALGFGTFGSPRNIDGVGSDPMRLAVGDFNRDGRRDLAVSDFQSPNGITILRGKGRGKFTALPEIVFGGNVSGVVAKRLDGDHDQDLVAAALDGNVYVLLGEHGASFASPQPYPAVAGGGGFSRNLVAADFDRDGRLDLVVNNQQDEQLSFLRGLGGGAFAGPVAIALPGASPDSVAAGNFNGDNKKDVVVTTFPASGPGESRVVVLRGRGDGTFRPPLSFASGPGPSGIAVADLDMDGHQDVAIPNFAPLPSGKNVASVLFGKGRGKLSKPHHYAVGFPGDQPSAIAAADFDRHRGPDLAVANAEASGPGEIAVLLNRGHRKFKRRKYYEANDSPSFLVTGRLNGDRAPDIADVNHDSQDVSILLNKR